MDLGAQVLLLCLTAAEGIAQCILPFLLRSTNNNPASTLSCAHFHHDLLSTGPIISCVKIGPGWAPPLLVSLYSQKCCQIDLSELQTALGSFCAQGSLPLSRTAGLCRERWGLWWLSPESLHPYHRSLHLPLLCFAAWVKDFIKKEACSLNKQQPKNSTNPWP